MKMNTYKVTLSESEVKGIGVSRWSAKQGRRLSTLVILSVFWLAAGLIMAVGAGAIAPRVAYAILAIVPPLFLWYYINKAFKKAGQNFLEMVKNEQG